MSPRSPPSPAPPSRSPGSFGASGHALDASLAEIDATCRKAARGAGFDWGMAEEAGRAARCLASWRIDGPAALLAVLDAVDGRVAAYAPRTDRSAWTSEAGVLCPVCTGAALSDHAARLVGGETIKLVAVLSPVLVLPFLCDVAREFALEQPSSFARKQPNVAGCGIASGNSSIERIGEANGIMACMNVSLGEIDSEEWAGFAERARSPAPFAIDRVVWESLERYASRTYAPATDASRASAGE